MTDPIPPKHRRLLVLDALANLLLGGVLLLAPAGALDWLGLPPADHLFYPVLLGAVLFGIGLALLLERYGGRAGLRGLGLDGAIAINLCGGGALLAWLLAARPALPLRGQVLLWLTAALVVGIGLVELAVKARAGGAVS